MTTKIELLKFIASQNEGNSVGLPGIDRHMSQWNITGKKLQEIVDSLAEENLIIRNNPMSVQITEKGIDTLKEG